MNTNDNNFATIQASDSNMEKINKNKNTVDLLKIALFKKYSFQSLMSAHEMVQRIRALAAELDDLSSIFGTHVTKGNN